MTLSFLPAARADIYKQFEYLLKEAGPTIALRFRAQVEIAAREAAAHPAIGTPVNYSDKTIRVRSWPIGTFPAIRLYYTHTGEELRIIRVLHGKRDIAGLVR